MYKRILIPLDGSERAEKVIPYVRELAQARGAHLLLLHVVEPPVIATPVVTPVASSAAPQLITLEDALKRAQEEAETYLKRKKENLESESISCEVLLEQGSVVQRIAHAAEANDVDLIAMTSHGRTGLATAFFGSVAVGVLHRVTRPVLLIRSKEE
jgi:nucleotide-binding universal stress UspA family protein